MQYQTTFLYCVQVWSWCLLPAIEPGVQAFQWKQKCPFDANGLTRSKGLPLSVWLHQWRVPFEVSAILPQPY